MHDIATAFHKTLARHRAASGLAQPSAIIRAPDSTGREALTTTPSTAGQFRHFSSSQRAMKGQKKKKERVREGGCKIPIVVRLCPTPYARVSANEVVVIVVVVVVVVVAAAAAAGAIKHPLLITVRGTSKQSQRHTETGNKVSEEMADRGTHTTTRV